jgi:hypothetical protein
MKTLLLILLLTTAVWAQAPRTTVDRVYSDWTAGKGRNAEAQLSFFQRHQDQFSPDLYQKIVKAYGYEGWPDSDLLCGGQVSVFGYSLENTQIKGDGAKVELFVRLGFSKTRNRVYGNQVILRRLDGKWRIDDVKYDAGTLRQSLSHFLDWKATNP